MKKGWILFISVCFLFCVCIENSVVWAADTFGITFGGYSIGGYSSEEKQKTVTATRSVENNMEMDGTTEVSAVYFGFAATELTIVSPSAIVVRKIEDGQEVMCEPVLVTLYEELQELHQKENGQVLGIFMEEALTEGSYRITVPAASLKGNRGVNQECSLVLHIQSGQNKTGANYENGILSWDKIEGAVFYQPILFADTMEGLLYSDGLNGRQLTIGMAALDGGWGKEAMFQEQQGRIIMDFVNGCEVLVDGHTYLYEILALDAEKRLIASQEATYHYTEPEEKISSKDGGEWIEENGQIFHIRGKVTGEKPVYCYRYLYYCAPGETEFQQISRKGGMTEKEYNFTSKMKKAGAYKVRVIVGNRKGFSDYSAYSEEYIVDQKTEEANIRKELEAVNPFILTEEEVNQIVDFLKDSTVEALEQVFASVEIKEKIAAIEERYLSFQKEIHSEANAELSAALKEKVSEIKGIGIAFLLKEEETGWIRLKAELIPESEKKEIDTAKYKENGVQIDLRLSGMENTEMIIPILIEMDLPVGLNKNGLRILHYQGDTYSEINPIIAGDKVIFPVSHFSTFVLVNRKTTGSGSSESSSSGGSRRNSSITPVLRKNQWEAGEGIWRYWKADGAYARNEWQQINGKWYHFNTEALMDTGWQLIDGNWYFMDIKEGDRKTDWQQINGKWYYLEPQSGTMQIGWLYWNQKWFYLKKDGDMVTGWQNIGGKWYYMTAYGDCLLHTITPDGYRVDENGVWVP